MHWKLRKFGLVVAKNVIFVVFVVGRWSGSALILRRMCGFVVPCVHVVWHRHYNQGSEPRVVGSRFSGEAEKCRIVGVMMFSILPLNIGDAFCFICLTTLTDFATSG